MVDFIIGSMTGLFIMLTLPPILFLFLDLTRVRVIKFRPLSGPSNIWYIAFSEREMHDMLGPNNFAEVIMPSKPWLIRIKRKLLPLRGIPMEVIDER